MRTAAVLSKLAMSSCAALLVVASGLALGGPAAATTAPPQDPNANGFIGLCDQNNNNVSGGDVHDAPFVWKAVASEPPPKDYLGRGENTVLGVYQPRPGADPGDWSGDQLTSASFYSSPKAPAAQATRKDFSLAVVIKEYPPMLDGLYELRMFFGKTNYGLYSATYPATYIRVAGEHWSVVSGGTVNCAAASGQSDEVASGVLTPEQAYGSATPAPPHGEPSSRPSTQAETAQPSTSHGSRTSPSTGTTPSNVHNESPVAARSSSPGHSSSSSVPWVITAIALALAAALAITLRAHTRNKGEERRT